MAILNTISFINSTLATIYFVINFPKKKNMKGGAHPGPPTGQFRVAQEALPVVNGHRTTAK